MTHPTTWLAAATVWVVVTMLLRRKRRWLLFYLSGAFGLVLLVALGAGMLDIDAFVEGVEAVTVAWMARALGMRVMVAQATGLAIPNHSGWAVFDIGLECSAILEMAAVVGLTSFYPAFRPSRRATLAAIGVTVTYVVNLLRILLIVAIINEMGTAWVFPAHAVFGRLFFFAATVTLYWFIVTRPTLGVVGRRVAEGEAR